jgi:hypothetical protein
MRLVVAAVVLAAPLLLSSPSWAEGQYAPGVTNTEIKIGNTMPYSGPASAVGVSGRAMAAYFAMINEHGGVNGRNITFISLDDAYSPPKTVEQTRRLVEQEGVAFMFAPLGTPTNSAIQGYLNEKRVPQLFLGSNASKWNQPSDPSRRGTSPRASPATGRPRGQGLLLFRRLCRCGHGKRNHRRSRRKRTGYPGSRHIRELAASHRRHCVCCPSPQSAPAEYWACSRGCSVHDLVDAQWRRRCMG